MNKNSYYYEKLAQSIIFSEDPWQQIVDPNDSHDNVYSKDFLTSLLVLLISYQRKSCLEEVEIKKLQTLLSDIRFTYPYSSRTEKEKIYFIINEMVRISNQISDVGIGSFYMEEYEKRYGVYVPTKIGKKLLARYFAYYLDDEPRGIKKDLAQDIYPLILLHHRIGDVTEEYIRYVSLYDGFLSTMNALYAENIELLKNPVIRGRFLYILRRNKELLTHKQAISSGNKKDDKMFEHCNQFVLRRLESIGKRKDK